MSKAISFDLWVTLIAGNPQFKKEKCSLIRRYFALDLSDEEILEAFKRADLLLDKIQEKFLIQPEYYTAWSVVLNEIGLKCTTSAKIKSFLRIYNQLFLEYPPILLDDAQALFKKLLEIKHLEICLLSNTILVQGKTLDKFIKTTVLKEVKAFYSDTYYPKPDERAFKNLGIKPFLHVGDNLIADGSCEDFGIEFYQVRTNGKTLEDFWQYIKPRL